MFWIEFTEDTAHLMLQLSVVLSTVLMLVLLCRGKPVTCGVVSLCRMLGHRLSQT